MDNKLTHHITMFNDRVRAMNQMHKQELRLTSVEANNVLSDIYAVLAEAIRLQAEINSGQNDIIQVTMDGGGFK
jgi:hypothetical protein